MSSRTLSLATGSWLVAGSLAALDATAQQPPAPGWAEPPRPNGQWAPRPPAAAPPSTKASSFESNTLYVTSAAYGLGLGLWLDAELELSDPALLLIPPTALGLAAPLGAYALNQPRLPRGVPGAIAAGLFIGASEGVGIATVQMVTSEDPWGFLGLSRAAALGSTLGGIGGYAVGVLQEPSPNISAFVTSGVVWGTLVGSAIGLGASEPGVGFSESNDWMARGGFVGLNSGLLVTMALSTAFVPTLDQLSWMWLGGGIGALVSLPVYLFYIDDDGPPAKRGLLFTATTTTAGIVAGGVFGPQLGDVGLGAASSVLARVDYITPFSVRGGLGLRVGGTLF
ncbi:MAG TPA: hypothetical protein VNN80_17360 [Polyangiaceae bacterium]|nr:hypothetical protein [Polyangiaceae bacterium]